MGAAVKGAVIRSQLNGLDLLGIRAGVLDALPKRTRALCDNPPSLVEWVPMQHAFDMAVAVAAQGGDTIERFGRAAGERLLATSFRPVIQGIFSVFGSNPHSLLARGELVLKAGFRGSHLTHRRLTEHSCECEAAVDEALVPIEYWRLWNGTLHHVFALCKREGTVQMTAPSEPALARFTLAWS